MAKAKQATRKPKPRVKSPSQKAAEQDKSCDVAKEITESLPELPGLYVVTQSVTDKRLSAICDLAAAIKSVAHALDGVSTKVEVVGCTVHGGGIEVNASDMEPPRRQTKNFQMVDPSSGVKLQVD